MSFLESVIRSSARIEDALDRLGAEGSGLFERATSVRGKIGEAALKRIKDIATIRNCLAHEPDYKYQGNEADVVAKCEKILGDLHSQFPQTIARDQQLPDASPLTDSTEEASVSHVDNNKWVEVDTGRTWGHTYLSTPERRLVYFRGGSVEVKPIGKHTVILRPPDAIGLVSMLPGHVTLRSDVGVSTTDGVPLNFEITLTLVVEDSDASIARVALDHSGQVAIAVNRALRAIHSVIQEEIFEKLATGWSRLSDVALQRVQRQSTEPLSRHTFSVVDLLFVHLRATDAALEGYRSEQAKQKVIQLQAEARLSAAKADAAVELARRKDIAQFERDESVRRQKDELEVKRLQADILATEGGRLAYYPELATSVEIERLKTQAQVLIAENKAKLDAGKSIVEVSILRGEINAYRKIVPGMQTLTISPGQALPPGEDGHTDPSTAEQSVDIPADGDRPQWADS